MTTLQAGVLSYFIFGLLFSIATLATAYIEHTEFVTKAALWEKLLAVIILAIVWPWSTYRAIRDKIKEGKR